MARYTLQFQTDCYGVFLAVHNDGLTHAPSISDKLFGRNDIRSEFATASTSISSCAIAPATGGRNPAADPITPAIAEAIRSGRKIEAIKLYREAHGVGLKEAKDAVDGFETTTRGVARAAQIANPAKSSFFRRLFGG